MIIQQEKAQDREKLLLKFIKIMKVSHKLLQLQHKRPVFCVSFNTVSLLPMSLLQHLRKLNNFNSYLAILSALDSAPIRRLEWQKQTSEVRTSTFPLRGYLPEASMRLLTSLTSPPSSLFSSSQGLEEYCTLIDSSSSFRAYRAALAEVEPPCIPYLYV